LEESREIIKKLGLKKTELYIGIEEIQLLELGSIMSKEVFAPCTIALIGDLGTGKTTFAKSLVSMLGYPQDLIRSPSFNIVNTYRMEKNTIFHIDTYRVTAQELYEIGFFEFFSSDSIVIIEWAEKILEDLESIDFLLLLEYNKENMEKRNITIFKRIVG
jgi:tRNA threonylcarbamoyladenosine biosynthesis protein TsaE